MKQITKEHYLFICLIVLNLVFAVFYGGDFGDSIDEQNRYDVALEAIENYSLLKPRNQIGNKGPSYLVTAKFGGDLIRIIDPDLSPIQSWHYIHFFSFILAIIGFYSICLNFLNPLEAFVTSALFNSQPVLFGHAFINAKDIPFMSLFILTIAVGLIMAQKLNLSRNQTEGLDNLKSIVKEVSSEWSALGIFQKVVFILLLIPIGTLSMPIFWKEHSQTLIMRSINNMEINWLNNIIIKYALMLFQWNLENGVSLQDVKTIYPLVVFTFIAAIFIYALIILMIFIPNSTKALFGISSKKEFLNGLKMTLTNPWLYLAGFILGFSVSTLSLGITAGGFVLLYIWVKYRSTFLPIAISYLSTSIIVLYITWPSLWAKPILGFLNSLRKNSTFSWDGVALLGGEVYSPKNLPLHYFPTLFGIQFTIPALVLIITGIVVYFMLRKTYKLDSWLFFIFFIWFWVPILAIYIVKPSIYNNFRHIFFAIPPLFFLAGLSVKYILSKFKSKILLGFIILVILLPGVIGIINLYPYQYLYYNEFIGGVEGAFRKYEMDYMRTSYLECITYLNKEASFNATVLVTGPSHIIESYARDDLLVIRYDEEIAQEQLSISDYFIISSRYNQDQDLIPENEIIYSVNRGEAILAVIKKITN